MADLGDDCVTDWIDRLRTGDETAARLLWDRYFEPLVRLARMRLWKARHPGADAEAEDAALSAFDSLCRRAKDGRFTELSDRNQLKRLLVHITLRKAADRINLRLRKKRGGGMVVGEADLPRRDSIDQPLLLDDLPGPANSPDLEAILSEGFDRMLEALDEDSLREIALGKLAGLTDRELAEQLKCSRRTITNKLKLIRLTWEDQP